MTDEPISIIATDNLVSCAICIEENNLLDKPGWKRFKHLAKRQKKLLRLQNQAKLQSRRTALICKFRYETPRSNFYEYVLDIDKNNMNIK